VTGDGDENRAGNRREAFNLFRRHLYYRGSYGRRSRYRAGTPSRFAVIALLVMAGIMVLASLLQSFYHGLSHGFHG
jgi:hypothetical protein